MRRKQDRMSVSMRERYSFRFFGGGRGVCGELRMVA